MKSIKNQMCQLWHFLSDDNDEIQPVKGLKWMSCLICALHFYFFPPNCLILPHLSHITLSHPYLTFADFTSFAFCFSPSQMWSSLFNYLLYLFPLCCLICSSACYLLFYLLNEFLELSRKTRTVNVNIVEHK